MTRYRIALATLLTLLLGSSALGAAAGGPVPLSAEVLRDIDRARGLRQERARVSEQQRDLDATGRELGPVLGTSAAPPTFRAGKLLVAAGEAVSATTRKFAAIRLYENEAETQTLAQLRKLKQAFVPRGVDYDAGRQIMAIAAVSRVVLYETTLGVVTILESPDDTGAPFGFANDVLFDHAGGVLIADEGDATRGRRPRDGAIWRYDLEEGTFARVAAKRKLSNPKLLARDFRGDMYVVDGEGGPLITPAFDFRYDALYQLRGKNLQNAKNIYKGPGIQATAYDIAPDLRHWFGNVTELLTLRKGAIEQTCALPPPFELITGIAVIDKTKALLLDGAEVKGGDETLYEVTRFCAATVRMTGRRLSGARGLALVEEAPE